jgi:hypothetical protein
MLTFRRVRASTLDGGLVLLLYYPYVLMPLSYYAELLRQMPLGKHSVRDDFAVQMLARNVGRISATDKSLANFIILHSKVICLPLRLA